MYICIHFRFHEGKRLGLLLEMEARGLVVLVRMLFQFVAVRVSISDC